MGDYGQDTNDMKSYVHDFAQKAINVQKQPENDVSTYGETTLFVKKNDSRIHWLCSAIIIAGFNLRFFFFFS